MPSEMGQKETYDTFFWNTWTPKKSWMYSIGNGNWRHKIRHWTWRNTRKNTHWYIYYALQRHIILWSNIIKSHENRFRYLIQVATYVLYIYMLEVSSTSLNTCFQNPDQVLIEACTYFRSDAADALEVFHE